MNPSWEHIIVSLLAAIPATIAAVSSVRNGRALKNGQRFTLPSERRDTLKETESGLQRRRFGPTK